MSDFRSFVRYLVPGIAFLIELALLLTFANSHSAFSWLSQSRKTADLGAVFGGVLALGGLGYFISILHHTLYWSSFGSWYAAADLRSLLRQLEKAGFLSLTFQDGSNPTPPAELSRAGAWRVVTALWHGRRESSQRIKGANPRADSLSDLMHGAGSALVACVLSIVVALLVSCQIFDHVNLYAILPAAFFLLFVHWICYRHTGAHAQGFVELVLFDELSAPPHSNSTQPSLSGKTEPPAPVQSPLVYRISHRELA
jgi:hypothetical protein